MDIKLLHIKKKYGEKQVLVDISLSFLEGKISCMMGASGIGKTTILNLIMGLIKPDSGEILGCQNKKIAVVFQEDRLIEHWDAYQNIELVCDKTITRANIREELAKVGIEADEKKPVRELSGGMKRRVALVRAILAKSDILLMDEPFKGLDDAIKQQVVVYVKQKTKGKTVIIVTHDEEDVHLLEGRPIILS